MVKGKSDSEFRQQASLSQIVSAEDEKEAARFRDLAGSDTELSDTIAITLTLCEFGILDKKNPTIKLMLALMNAQRKARFATSEKNNEITKLGLMTPRSNPTYYDE